MIDQAFIDSHAGAQRILAAGELLPDGSFTYRISDTCDAAEHALMESRRAEAESTLRADPQPSVLWLDWVPRR
jgi:hypothetical protein